MNETPEPDFDYRCSYLCHECKFGNHESCEYGRCILLPVPKKTDINRGKVGSLL